MNHGIVGNKISAMLASVVSSLFDISAYEKSKKSVQSVTCGTSCGESVLAKQNEPSLLGSVNPERVFMFAIQLLSTPMTLVDAIES